MKRANVVQEVRQMRIEELYARRQQRTVTMAEASKMLGMTERTLRRRRGRSDAAWNEGLQDRRLGRPSVLRCPWMRHCAW